VSGVRGGIAGDSDNVGPGCMGDKVPDCGQMDI